jgi:uncharacterized protein YlxP (DUF503 family)
MTVHALALVIDLRIPQAHSLKDKRSVITTLLEGSRRRFAVAAAETDRPDDVQQAQLTMVAVSGSAHHTTEVVDGVDRFVWSFPEIEVVDTARYWLEID